MLLFTYTDASPHSSIIPFLFSSQLISKTKTKPASRWDWKMTGHKEMATTPASFSQYSSSARSLQFGRRGGHRRRVVLHDCPVRGTARVPPEGEAETRPLLLGFSIFALPCERVRARVDREISEDADSHGRVLGEPQLRQTSKVVLRTRACGRFQSRLVNEFPDYDRNEMFGIF